MTSSSRQTKRRVLNNGAGQAGAGTSNRSALLLLGLVVAGFFVFSYLERLNELAVVRAEVVSLQNNLAQAEQRNAELEALRQQVAGAEYVGETARAELGLILPGDDPFVVLGQPPAGLTAPNGTEANSVLSNPRSAQVEIFQAAWWRSLFGLQ